MVKYSFLFRSIAEGETPEEGYEVVKSTLQVRAPEEMPLKIMFRYGAIMAKMASGHPDGNRVLIPKGQVLEIILEE